MNTLIGILTCFFIGYVIVTIFSRKKITKPSNPSQGGSSGTDGQPDGNNTQEMQ
jgi:hypothetical protein